MLPYDNIGYSKDDIYEGHFGRFITEVSDNYITTYRCGDYEQYSGYTINEYRITINNSKLEMEKISSVSDVSFAGGGTSE